MYFKRFSPASGLEPFIECYWVVEDEDSSSRQQKIIPDGFTEIIFHYGDPYRMNLNGQWETQSRSLLAGQIRRHFFLENTGTSGIVAIKLKPTALTHLYGLFMQTLTDKVVSLSGVVGDHFLALEKTLGDVKDHEEKIHLLNVHFSQLVAGKPINPNAADIAVERIFQTQGMTPIHELAVEAGIGERQLENLFRKFVGLSPKIFSRIIRFSYIFQLVQNNMQSWPGLAYEASFFDQSHFIRNFRDFTGENPTDYAFDQENLANFFLHKK